MEIRVLEGNVNYYREANNIHVLAFGTVKVGSKVAVKIKIDGVTASSLTNTCGCTTSTSEEKNVFDIAYKETHNAVPFSKVFILNYREGSNNAQGQIKITGNVIR